MRRRQLFAMNFEKQDSERRQTGIVFGFPVWEASKTKFSEKINAFEK